MGLTVEVGGTMDNLISQYADFVALVYHEGRNVRHLEEEQLSIDSKFVALRGLAANRQEAWQQLRPLRLEAATTQSASQVELKFQQGFRLTLDELAVLYAHPGWKQTAYGGNAWLPVAVKVRELGRVIDAGDEAGALHLADQVLEMSHNTGKAGDKLKSLSG
jgi:hypothetical protein